MSKETHTLKINVQEKVHKCNTLEESFDGLLFFRHFSWFLNEVSFHTINKSSHPVDGSFGK